ncbi:hypothetical protein SAMN06265370_112123 [Puniceibacterium sediminis]|uniref:Component of SufBCD complex n=2 Tax=Puniceibacterium sediminis TaxID=1608407 RepID=A0A238XTK2_9RHOB|nr:hypothetical protein SAMN06265370_112123 [Puniceibacterium sediminis]
MRSFSSLWFWIAVAVIWSAASHRVMGVPFDMVTRARSQGGQAEIDLDELVRINANRMLRGIDGAGLWLLALGCFVIVMLALLAFVYWIELAQAVFLLGFPLTLVWLLTLRVASRIRAEGATGEVVQTRLGHLRIATQAIGMTSIFVTSLWGMYQNLSAGILG